MYEVGCDLLDTSDNRLCSGNFSVGSGMLHPSLLCRRVCRLYIACMGPFPDSRTGRLGQSQTLGPSLWGRLLRSTRASCPSWLPVIRCTLWYGYSSCNAKEELCQLLDTHADKASGHQASLPASVQLYVCCGHVQACCASLYGTLSDQVMALCIMINHFLLLMGNLCALHFEITRNNGSKATCMPLVTAALWHAS